MGQFSYNPLNGNLDFSSNSLEAGTLEFMGNISVASDFPTSAQVQENDIYRVLANVTDNDGTKTNTGQSFVEGDEIMWDGVAWEILGNYVSLLGTNNTWTGTNVFGGISASSLTLTGSGVNLIATNTADGSDDKAITLAGGGAYGPTRGSGIAVIGNEYATIGGDLELMAGDSAVSGAIKHYVGNGAGGAYLAVKTERTTGLTSFYGGIDCLSLTQLRYAVTIGGNATADAVGLEIGNTSGGTPYIDFKSSAVDYNVRIINGTSSTLSFLGATGGYFFDTAVNSIYNTVNTSASATLTTITQGITVAGNLVTSAYVTDGYTAGLTWASTDDNSSKPKAGVFMRTTGSGSQVILGTSSSYATGITYSHVFSSSGNFSTNSVSASSSVTSTNVLDLTASSLTTGGIVYAYSNSSDTGTRSLSSFINDHASSVGTTVFYGQQDSTGTLMNLIHTGVLATNKDGFIINCTGANTNGNTSAMYVLQSNASTDTPVLRLYHAGNGRGIQMETLNTTATALNITASSLTTGRGATIYSNSSSTSQFVLLDLTNANAAATGMIPLAISNASPTSTNYFRMMYLGGNSGGNFLWKANGVTPNGNLSGNVGDFCIGADGGKAYYCTGGTSWTAA